MFFVVPLELKQPGTRPSIPVANALLIAVNALMFVCGKCQAVGPGSGLLSIVLYGFCHFGFWHLLFNMWALWVFGTPVNRRLGNAWYLVAYLGSIAAVGLIARIFLHVSLAGSSGGIFAVIAIALILMPAAVLEIGYLALFPLTVLIGLLKLPKHGLYWFIRAGTFSLQALWCLALIPLMQLWSFFWSGWNWTYGAHLLGMVCGVAVVLMLPPRISMGRRSMAGIS